ncbi:hypothetical protein ABBQ38_010290 [Trebouxia sp. C0009 RCD-2024]
MQLKVRETKKPLTGKRKQATAEAPPQLRRAGGDDDDFADLVVEEEELGESDQNSEGTFEAAAESPGVQPVKKLRKKKRRKGSAAYQEAQAAAAEVAHSSADEQVQWLWDSYKNAVGESFLEQEALTGDSVLQLSGQGSVEEQMQAAVPQWQQVLCSTAGRPAGHPTCLIISPAALGAIAMIKSFPTFNKACRIAKLFAKHIKVAEQQAHLQQHPLCIAAGTPNRLCKLADVEALQLSQLQLVVLDVHQDAKKRTILDFPETKKDFWELFSRHLQKLLQSGQTRICLINSGT